MVVDFALRRAPELKLATRTLKGTWPGDEVLRAEFEKLAGWAKGKGLRTGRWVFAEVGDYDSSEEKMRYEVSIELKTKGPVRGGKGVRIKSLPASTVATITFDPDQISPRVMYHGLADWIRWKEKSKEYKEAGPYREVYAGNPWKSKAAWKHTMIQVPLKKLGR